MTEKEKEQPKLCPLMYRQIPFSDLIEAKASECLKEKCALWVEVYKGNEIYGATDYWEGCGLIQTLAWKKIPKDREVTESE